MPRAENPKVKESVAASFTPADSPMTYEDYAASDAHVDLSTPRVAVGEPAIDFELPLYDFSDGSRRDTGETFHLMQVAANQPVALVFGSYT